MTDRPGEFGLTMVREDLADIPQFDLPGPFTFRWYRPGDEACWLGIHELADKYSTLTGQTFGEQFGLDAGEIERRQVYLCDAAGQAIGTATAWFDGDYDGKVYGRVHWIAIVPAFQGRRLAKPLLSAVCIRLRELGHERAYLTSGTVRVRAISLYLKFGFVPRIETDRDLRAWRLMRDRLGDSALAEMDLGQ